MRPAAAALLALPLLVVGAGVAPDDLPIARANDNRTPAGVRVGDTLVVRLVVARVRWHIHADTDPAFTLLAFAEEGKAPSIPGPLLRVREGTTVRATVRNPLGDTLVVYGLGTRGDGVPDSLLVAPGATAEARFAAGAPGTWLYWAASSRTRARGLELFGRLGGRGAAAAQLASLVVRRDDDDQLAGAFVVDPARGAIDTAERIFVVTSTVDTLRPDGTFFRNRWGVPLREFVALNGKAWPHTERLAATVGDSIRWRIVNASLAPHPMHLHGFHYRVDGRGDAIADVDTVYAPAARSRVVTDGLTQGRSMRLTWSPSRPGGWVFHCHLTMHAVRMGAVDRPEQLEFPEEHQAHDPDRHALTGMGGLVLATTVRPRGQGGDVARRAWAPARRLRVFVQSDSAPGDSTRRFGYVLQRDGRAPAPDSIEATGSVLVLRRGEATSIDVVNRTGDATAVHWHGIELESYFDGVVGYGGMPGRTTPAIRAGSTFEARMRPPRAGTFMYHTHFDELRQQHGGLTGVLLVLEPGERWDPRRDLPFLVTGAAGGRIRINGALAPDTLELRAGTTYRLRLANLAVDRPLTRVRLVRDTTQLSWRVVAKDGWSLARERIVAGPALQWVGSGETVDVEFTPDRAGMLQLQVVPRSIYGRVGAPLATVPFRVVAQHATSSRPQPR